MRMYVAGKITGDENYKEKFESQKKELQEMGFDVVLPTCLPTDCNFTHEDFMHICFAMIDRCDAVVLLPDWKESKGAAMEALYAEEKGLCVLGKEKEQMVLC